MPGRQILQRRCQVPAHLVDAAEQLLAATHRKMLQRIGCNPEPA